jgi:hypothetical protein
MKKLLFILGFGLMSFNIQAQPQNRPLPNQFRDFVDHQQRFGVERPTIEKRDGKVIITMSEEHFNRMRRMRMEQRTRMVSFRQEPPCRLCQKGVRKPHRKSF